MFLHVFVSMVDVLVSTLAIRVVWGTKEPPTPNLLICLAKPVYMNTLKADGGMLLGHIIFGVCDAARALSIRFGCWLAKSRQHICVAVSSIFPMDYFVVVCR